MLINRNRINRHTHTHIYNSEVGFEIFFLCFSCLQIKRWPQINSIWNFIFSFTSEISKLNVKDHTFPFEKLRVVPTVVKNKKPLNTTKNKKNKNLQNRKRFINSVLQIRLITFVIHLHYIACVHCLCKVLEFFFCSVYFPPKTLYYSHPQYPYESPRGFIHTYTQIMNLTSSFSCLNKTM